MLNYLKEGNSRFVRNEPRHKDFKEERGQLSTSQSPYVTLVTCSDSRTPAEYIFDESLGKFFVIRTAGNVLDKIELGSIEYAVLILETPLLVIMGHTTCGAVKAVLDNQSMGSVNLESIIDKIAPSVNKVKERTNDYNQIWADSIKENIIYQINFLQDNSKILRDYIKSGKLQVIGAIYNIESGIVEFIENI